VRTMCLFIDYFMWVKTIFIVVRGMYLKSVASRISYLICIWILKSLLAFWAFGFH